LDLEYYSYWEYSLEKNKKIEELENAVEKVVIQALNKKQITKEFNMSMII